MGGSDTVKGNSMKNETLIVLAAVKTNWVGKIAQSQRPAWDARRAEMAKQRLAWGEYLKSLRIA